MKPKQLIANLRTALLALNAEDTKATKIEQKIGKETARRDELVALEEPTNAEVRELVSVERALPFLAPQLEKARSAFDAQHDVIEKIITDAWAELESEINGRELTLREHAAQAILPFCDSLAQARDKTETLPAVARLNHLSREWNRQIAAGEASEVAEEIVKFFSADKPGKARA